VAEHLTLLDSTPRGDYELYALGEAEVTP